jgi:hypothetical protein
VYHSVATNQELNESEEVSASNPYKGLNDDADSDSGGFD